MTFSVLICTYNRHELLAQALESLSCSTEEKPDQVVVVNGGDHRTDDVVNHYRSISSVAFTLVQTVNKNLAASRNVGLSHCDGDIIAMTDDDAQVFPDWVTRMKLAHETHPEAGVIGGAVIGAGSSTNFLSRLSDQVTFVLPDQAGYVRTVPGVNASYKSHALKQVGPQDESLFRGEDVDFNWRMSRAGYKVYFDPTIKVIHHHRPDLVQFLRQHYMYGRAYYLVRRKWTDMYCIYPHRVSGGRDVARLVNFVLAVFYEPFQYAARLENPLERVLAIPVLMAVQIAWRGGMIVQKLKESIR